MTPVPRTGALRHGRAHRAAIVTQRRRRAPLYVFARMVVRAGAETREYSRLDLVGEYRAKLQRWAQGQGFEMQTLRGRTVQQGPSDHDPYGENVHLLMIVELRGARADQILGTPRAGWELALASTKQLENAGLRRTPTGVESIS